MSAVFDSQIAAVIDDQEITYRRFKSDVAQACAFLDREIGNSERHVAVAVRGAYWQWVLALALLRSEKVSATVNRKTSLTGLAEHFDVCIGEASLTGVRRVDFDVSGMASLCEQWAKSEQGLNPEEPLVVLNPGTSRWILTSGTTGRPKIVAISASMS